MFGKRLTERLVDGEADYNCSECKHHIAVGDEFVCNDEFGCRDRVLEKLCILEEMIEDGRIVVPGTKESKHGQIEFEGDFRKPKPKDFKKKKKKWEDGFQKWSNEQGMKGEEAFGACGYGSMCDYCKDNSYGRPCVRALNAMIRDKWINVKYDKLTYEDAWCGNFKKE